MNRLIFTLAMIGAIVVLTILIVIIAELTEKLKYYISKKKLQYKIKHRFDKPPTAKCYRIDCTFWAKEQGECGLTAIYKYTNNNEFCSWGEPRTYDVKGE